MHGERHVAHGASAVADGDGDGDRDGGNHGNFREIHGFYGFLWIAVGLLLDSNVLWNLF